jgi:hypothetical protein
MLTKHIMMQFILICLCIVSAFRIWYSWSNCFEQIMVLFFTQVITQIKVKNVKTQNMEHFLSMLPNLWPKTH